MTSKKIISDNELVASYALHKSVWKVGDQFGISGQTVHTRLNKIGVKMSEPEFTEAQKLEIVRYYTDTDPKYFNLNALCIKYNKSKANISRCARRLGLTNIERSKSEDATSKRRGRPASLEAIANQKKARANQWLNKPHPRGMAGKKHSKETLLKVSAASKATWLKHKANNTGLMAREHLQKMSDAASIRMSALPAGSSYSRAKWGFREDIGIFVRSSWEANYARYLNLLMRMGIVESWEYESETFWFKEIQRGVRSYKPDFKVKYKNTPDPERVEVKGWVQAKDRTKWSRMKKYHPEIRLVIVGAKEYRSIQNKWKSAISNWE